MRMIFYGLLAIFSVLGWARKSDQPQLNKSPPLLTKPPIASEMPLPLFSSPSTYIPSLQTFEVPIYRQSMSFDQVWAFDKKAVQPFNGLQTITGPFGVFLSGIEQRNSVQQPMKLTFAVNAYNIPNIYDQALVEDMAYTSYFFVTDVLTDGKPLEFSRQDNSCVDNGCGISDGSLIKSNIASEQGPEKSLVGFQVFGWDIIFLSQPIKLGAKITVKGAIHLSIATATKQLSSKLVDNKVSFADTGFKLEMVQIKAGTFGFEIVGQEQNILSIRGKNADGKYIYSNGITKQWYAGEPRNKGNMMFSQKIDVVELIIAKSFECRTFDFEFTAPYQADFYLQDNAIPSWQQFSTSLMDEGELGNQCAAESEPARYAKKTIKQLEAADIYR